MTHYTSLSIQNELLGLSVVPYVYYFTVRLMFTLLFSFTRVSGKDVRNGSVLWVIVQSWILVYEDVSGFYSDIVYRVFDSQLNKRSSHPNPAS